MELNSQTVVLATVVFAAAGILFVLVAVALERRPRKSGKPKPGKKKPGKKKRGAIELPCPTCKRPLVIHKNDLVALSGPEIGLLVSATGREAGGKPGSFRCPYCKSEHIFSMEKGAPQWIATDSFEPHQQGKFCADCRAELLRPTWPRGALDDRVTTAPELQPKHGLVCSRCDAVSCVECVHKATRNRTKDGSLLCPRCFRGPVNRVHHW